jgi:serine/threonine-protein kinase
MITCARCGTENLDGSQYCDECGMLLLKEPARAPSSFGPIERDRARKTGPPFELWSRSGMSEPHAKLVIERGRAAGKEFFIDADEAQIGRWDADNGIFPDIDLDAYDPETKVSRRHARIWREGSSYFIEDLGSTNGTFINRGRRLLPGERIPLHDGDEIIVGKTFLRFHVIKFD